MKKEVRDLKSKYIKWIPCIGIVSILLWFLPYVSVKEIGVSWSGFKLLTEAMQAISTEGISLKNCGVIGIIGISSMLVLISSVMNYFKPTKSTQKITIILFALYTLSMILVLFTSKKTIDSSQMLEVDFLIKYLGAGYWLSLMLGFLGLLVSMKVAKISPGYIVLSIMSVIWLFPLFWIILNSFRTQGGSYVSYFLPKNFTIHNYVKLLTDNSQFYYSRWFLNTLLVAVCTCFLSTFIVLSTSFVLSRIRFAGRKTLMESFLVMGMFPGFMSMIAVYYILKGLGITQSLIALVIVYSAGASLTYYIAKGFFDTIPKSLDEAAFLDGATKWQLFTKITMPLSKPIIIYTVLTSFMAPWGDFIFARIIVGDNYDNYTVALGLYNMLTRENIEEWYTRFAAGTILISLPIALLFITLQKYYVEGLSGSVKG